MAVTHVTRQSIARESRQRFIRLLSTSSAPHSDESGYPSALPASALTARGSNSSRFNRRPPADRSATPAELVQKLITRQEPSHDILAARRREAEEQLKRSQLIRDLDRQNPRQWRPGNLYSPHDLSPMEMQKWNRKNQGARDVFDVLGINPLHEYKNVAILNDFLTPLGRIKHRSETGLRPVNQRKISKAIRRAVAMGLIPSVHRHPEIIEVEEKKRNEERFGKDGRRGVLVQ